MPRAEGRRGFCGAHYSRFLRHGDPLAGGKPKTRQGAPCAVESCDRTGITLGYCGLHYQRLREYGDPDAPLRRPRAGEGNWRITNYGYVQRRVRGKNILQHREVMEEMLGRPLVPGETVHHKNGIRHDNRPENLELWVSTRSGQRVEDLVAFVVGQYPGLVAEALRVRAGVIG